MPTTAPEKTSKNDPTIPWRLGVAKRKRKAADNHDAKAAELRREADELEAGDD